MSFSDKLRTVVIVCTLVHQANSQTTGTNVPDSPLWPVFAELLSTQTGRTVQDINILGLSDPTINQLWTAYSATLIRMTQTPSPTPGTTPPPLPDLYQTSYSFSSTSSNLDPNSQKAPPRTDTMLSYTQILSLINELSNTGSSPGNTITGSASNTPQGTSTSMQDVMNAYSQLKGKAAATGSANSNPTQTAIEQQTVAAGGSATGRGSTPGTGSTAAAGGTDYQALLKQYAMGGGGPTESGKTGSSLSQLLGMTGASQKSTSSASPSYQVLLDQYNSIMKKGSPNSSSSNGGSSGGGNSGGGGSSGGSGSGGGSSGGGGGGGGSGSGSGGGGVGYEQLLQQYNQIMGGKSYGTSSTIQTGSSGTPASLVEQYTALMSKTGSGTGPTSNTVINPQLLQMYSQLMGGQNSGTLSTSVPKLNTTTPAPPPASPQEIFEKQLATLFPQFNSPPPQSSAGNATAATAPGTAATASNLASSNAAQMIFDALLFAPVATAAPPTVPSTGPSAQTSAVNSAQKMVNSPAGARGTLNDHVQNVFKTRASREMGCRFLPELLELDLLPTAPINCLNRCPFPYVNSQKFGVYCVCCPPGVNEHTVGMMSLVRGSSYMETPLAVIA